jgi:two-component system, chemotaxis family, protein-glutamate methylesterase/glutaminase
VVICIVLNRPKAQFTYTVSQVARTQPGSQQFQSVHVKRILLVDDDRLIRQIVRKALENELGWICDEAENGQDGISKARALKPDLIVLDLSMPVMNGFEAAQVLSRDMPTVPVVMMTMYADVIGKSSTAASMIGVTKILSKTDGTAGLIECAKKILEAL